jgi:hypothetical protein
MPLANGVRLGPYQITAWLGAGGMGDLYRASDTRLGRTVAVKVLPGHFAGSPNRRARLAREARAVSRLSAQLADALDHAPRPRHRASRSQAVEHHADSNRCQIAGFRAGPTGVSGTGRHGHMKGNRSSVAIRRSRSFSIRPRCPAATRESRSKGLRQPLKIWAARMEASWDRGGSRLRQPSTTATKFRSVGSSSSSGWQSPPDQPKPRAERGRSESRRLASYGRDSAETLLKSFCSLSRCSVPRYGTTRPGAISLSKTIGW